MTRTSGNRSCRIKIERAPFNLAAAATPWGSMKGAVTVNATSQGFSHLKAAKKVRATPRRIDLPRAKV